MPRNDLMHWVVYWLGCNDEQAKVVNNRLRSMTMDELREIDRRASQRDQSASVLKELLSSSSSAQLASL